MKRLLLLAFVVAAAVAPGAAAAADKPRVLEIRFAEEINPITQDWLNGQLDRAARDHYDAAVIVLDTPGGLIESMRKIIQKELSVRVPVVVYVSPRGARAASAGVGLSLASDLLAMAPETNIGSSTPIDSSGQDTQKDLRRKLINDLAAQFRALAKTHHRDVVFADRAVRVAENLTAAEARARGVTELIAPSLPRLLDRIDGRTTVPRDFKLHTRNAEVTTVEPGFLTRFLSTLIDPNIAGLLFLAGIAGLGFELFHPGVVIPGAFGAICMITALYAFSVLPLSWGGLILVLLGVALLIVDAHVTTHGALTLSGLVAIGVGLATLFHDAPSPYHTSIPLIVTVTAVLGGFWALALGKAVGARRAPVSVGPQQIVGMEGVVRDGGLVFVRGELWRVRSDEPLEPGQRVRVDELDGLTLRVHPTA